MRPSPAGAIKRFARAMAQRMEENRHKRGWESMTPQECYKRALDEMAELYEALAMGDKSHARSEAADVANFLMMLDHSLAPIAEKKEM